MPAHTKSHASIPSNLAWSLRLQTVSVWLFHLTLLSIPFLFSFDTSELFEFNKMIAVYVYTTLLVGLLVVRSILEKKILFVTTPLDWAVALFVGSQLLATLASIHLQTSIFGYYSRFHGGLLSTLSYVALMYVFINTVSKKQLLGFFATLLIGASLASLYAIPERFHFSPSCLLLSLNEETTGQPMERITTDCWSGNTNPKYRVFGTFGQPNWLAAYVVTLLPLSFFFVATRQKKPLALLGSVATVLLFVALLFTKSRSGVLGLGVAGAVAGVVLSGAYWQTRRATQVGARNAVPTPGSKMSAIHKLPIYIASLVFVLALIFGTPFTPTLTTLLQQSSSSEVASSADPQPLNRLEVGGTDSGEIRQIVWQGALAVWRRYPLFGSGVETFGYSYYLDRPVTHNLVSEWDFLYNKAHNEFLNLLATTGTVGLAGYLILLSSFGILCLKIMSNNQQSSSDRGLALSIFAGVAGLSVTNFFGFSTVSVSVLLFLFFGCAVILAQRQTAGQTNLLSQATKSPNRSRTSLAWWQIFALVVTGGVTLTLLHANYNYWKADTSFATGQKYLQSGYAKASVQFFQEAIRRSPNEASYYSDLGQAYSQVALGELQAENATAAAQFAQVALESGAQAVRLNPQQRNFYKSFVQILIRLSQLNPELLEQAQATLEQAITLAPTDARLVYNLALIQEAQGDSDGSRESLKKAIALKQNYTQARIKLGQLYLDSKQYDLAQTEFAYVLEFLAPGDTATQELLDQAKNNK